MNSTYMHFQMYNLLNLDRSKAENPKDNQRTVGASQEMMKRPGKDIIRKTTKRQPVSCNCGSDHLQCCLDVLVTTKSTAAPIPGINCDVVEARIAGNKFTKLSLKIASLNLEREGVLIARRKIHRIHSNHIEALAVVERKYFAFIKTYTEAIATI